MGIKHGRKIGTRKFQMQEKMLSIGDDHWIEDEDGNRVFKVDGKAARMRETFVLEDMEGQEVARIREKKLSIRDTMTIEIGGREAKVKERKLGFRDRFVVNFNSGDDFKGKGNFVDHEYEIDLDGDTVAEISKKWFSVRDTYGVELRADQDPAVILAITVCIDAMAGVGD